MLKILLIYSVLLIFCLQAKAQRKPEFDGQASVFGKYSPDNSPDALLAGRYIPELSYRYELASGNSFHFESSANMFASVSASGFSNFESSGKIQAYRLWGRYSSKQFEFRLGLQKIDFGSATLLRPLQWFNQIDPRDPIKLTNGVYGALGRYYFRNNANIWLWLLYGNKKTRGFDALKTQKNSPEYGGRVQFPVSRGELAASVHHRTADSRGMTGIAAFSKIPENRFALDGKWDVLIGLWFEASHIHKQNNLGILTNQTLLNVGADYTFGLGNGLNVIGEHLVMAMDQKAFRFENTAHVTASTLSYPLSLSTNLSSIAFYSWEQDALSFFVNFQHQFKKITGYLMAYHNQKNQSGLRENELISAQAGPGIQIMLVYNH